MAANKTNKKKVSRTNKNAKAGNNSDNSSKNLGVVFAIISALLFITLCWYAYIYFVDQNTQKGIIYIKADRTPFKVVPDNPGGMVIEYTDKKVFDRITGASEKITRKNVAVIEEEKPLNDGQINALAMKYSNLDQEEYQNAAKVILEPIVKEAKQNGDDVEVAAAANYSVRKKSVINLENIKADSNKELEDDKKGFEDIVNEVSSVNNVITNDNAKEKAEEGSSENSNKNDIKEAFEDISNKMNGKADGDKKAKPINSVVKEGVKVTRKPSKLLISEPDKQEVVAVNNVDVKSTTDKKTGKSKTTILFGKNKPKSLSKSKKVDVDKSSTGKTAPGFYVQVSSHTKLSDLEKSWKIFKRKYGQVVSDANKNITKASVNGKQFYRLSFGAYKTKIQAQSKCKSLKAKGRDCLIKYY